MIYHLNSMILAGVVVIGLGATTHAGELLVAGSPGYNPATSTGLTNGGVPIEPGSCVNNSGMAVGVSQKYDSGTNLGLRAVRWNSSGTGAIELGTLGASSSESMDASAFAINDAGTAVGYTQKSVEGAPIGPYAVRWDVSGTATELLSLGNNGSFATAVAINGAGLAVGSSDKYVSGSYMGSYPVRWNASGVAATELDNLDINTTDLTYAAALAVSNAGTAVGFSSKSIDSTYYGQRAVRWDASGTTATELGTLGTRLSDGTANAQASAVNASGTAVGYSEAFVNGESAGTRAVRWGSSSTVAIELDNLGTNGSGPTFIQACAVNDSGTAVGYGDKYDNGYKGVRAVRWDGSGTAATVLTTLGADSSGYTNAGAYAVNNAGTAVGYSQKYVGDEDVGSRAVIWLPDASVIDLNDLGVVPVPAGGTWMLTQAKALSADGWVAGEGWFVPNSDDPDVGYSRLWVAQVGLGGTWTNAAGGTWGRGPNWSTGTPAMQVGNAEFNTNSAYAVALDRNELTKTIAIKAGTVTINSNGHSLTTENGLSISNGATLKEDGAIGGDITNDGTLEMAPSGPISYTGKISGMGNFTKSGTGTLTLSGANTYTGITTVSAGKLLVNGNQSAATGAVNVTGAGTTLGGTGTIGGAVSISAGSVLSPGASVGTLGTGALTMASGSKWTAEHLGATVDRVNITGNLDLTGADLDFSFSALNPFTAGTYTLATYTGTLTGTFGSVTNLGAYVSGTGISYGGGNITLTLLASLVPGDANLDRTTNFSDYSVVATNYNTGSTWTQGDVNGDGVVNFSDYSVIATNYGSTAGFGSPIVLQGVPEPGTLVLLGTGLLAWAWRRRRA